MDSPIIPSQNIKAKERPAVSVALLAALTFVAFLDNFSQLPIVAPRAQSFGAAGTMIGWIVGAYSLTNMIGNGAAGYSLDRWGRRTPLTVGFLWAGIGFLIYAFIETPVAYLLARGFHGLGGGILVPAIFTVAGDSVSKESRGAAMGRIGATIGMAAVFGPLLGGVLAERFGVESVFVTVFGVMMIAACVAWFRIPFTSVEKEPSTSSGASGVFGLSDMSPAARRVLALACLGSVLVSSSQGAMTVLLPLQLEGSGFSASRVGMLFSVFAIVAVIVMVALPRFVAQGHLKGETPLGIAFMGVAFTGMAYVEGFLAIAALMALYGAGFGLLYPALNTAVANAVGQGRRGRAFGLFYAFFSVGFIVIPPVVGWLSQISLASAYLATGIGLLAFAVLYLVSREGRTLSTAEVAS